MKRWTTLLLVFAAVMLWSGSVLATPAAPPRVNVMRMLAGTITMPPEWDGLWATIDTLSDCGHHFTQISSDYDTICAGEVYHQEDSGGQIADCTGTATATTLNATCTALSEAYPDCNQVTNFTVVGTRTGDTYKMIVTTTVSYSGTGYGCDLYEPECYSTIVHGTRVGPAPVAHCAATPTRTSTWGELKIRYR